MGQRLYNKISFSGSEVQYMLKFRDKYFGQSKEIKYQYWDSIGIIHIFYQ